MVDLGAYPACYRDPEGRGVSVVGEVWECNDECLANLDRLEGHPTFYQRELIRVATGCESRGFDAPEALIYLVSKDYVSPGRYETFKMSDHPKIKDGYWNGRGKNNYR